MVVGVVLNDKISKLALDSHSQRRVLRIPGLDDNVHFCMPFPGVRLAPHQQRDHWH